MHNPLAELIIRPIQKVDDLALARLIKSVMPEFGASGPGFAIQDAEVDSMFENYCRPRTFYLVVEKNNEVIGGGGIAPLDGGDANTCELRKMYFYPQARGFGLGNVLLKKLLEKAKELDFKRCYLETLERMDSANYLYQKFGFERMRKPLGSTGHFGCDRWYVKDLR